MWGNLVPPLFIRIFTVLNKTRVKNKGYMKKLVKFIVCISVLLFLSSCGSSNGLVKGPKVKCRGGVCYMYN